jgi:predicted ATPase
MDHHRFHVITGASGSGKSTPVAALEDLGYSTVPEAAFAILKEQLSCNGTVHPRAGRGSRR